VKIYNIFLLLFLPLMLHQNSAAEENWVAYGESISVEDYRGCPFHLNAYVKAEREDDSASARLWVRIDKKTPGGFLDNMWYRPIRSNEWKVYSIEGTIDSNADRLSFGALCQFNGRFYYDNIKVEVEKENDEWVTLIQSDFEKDEDLWVQGAQSDESGSGFNSLFSSRIQFGEAALGNGCLIIEGKDVPNFGVNKKVGRYADVNGIRLYYEIYGEGDPLRYISDRSMK